MKLKHTQIVAGLAVAVVLAISLGTLSAQDSTKAPVKDSVKPTPTAAPAKEASKDTTKPAATTTPVKTDSAKATDTTKTKSAFERGQDRAKAAADKAKAAAADSIKKLTGGDSTKVDSTKKVAKADDLILKPSGVRYRDIKVGEGAEAALKDKLVCYYTVWLSDKGGKGILIQSSKEAKEPFACQLGVNLVPGWTDGMIGMKPGGIRELHVPYSQGYGEQGIPGAIPGKADLIFEIDYLEPCTDATCIIDPDPRMRGMLKYIGTTR